MDGKFILIPVMQLKVALSSPDADASLCHAIKQVEIDYVPFYGQAVCSKYRDNFRLIQVIKLMMISG